jgi:hypothetical protein
MVLIMIRLSWLKKKKAPLRPIDSLKLWMELVLFSIDRDEISNSLVIPALFRRSWNTAGAYSCTFIAVSFWVYLISRSWWSERVKSKLTPYRCLISTPSPIFVFDVIRSWHSLLNVSGVTRPCGLPMRHVTPLRIPQMTSWPSTIEKRLESGMFHYWTDTNSWQHSVFPNKF